MRWKPKHPAFKGYAKLIKTSYLANVKKMSGREAVLETAKEFKLSGAQIYRYLQYLEVELANPDRKRNAKGQYSS